MDTLSDEQKRALKRKIEALRTLEQEVEQLRDDRIQSAARRLGVTSMATVSALSVFGQTADWRRLDAVDSSARQPVAVPTRLTWEMIKKAVAEEEKYQSKKNWSSTKGRGNRKAPVARRLDAEVLKRFGVYPEIQFPMLATCDTCGHQVNAHFLREHQEINCSVSSVKRDEKRVASTKVREKSESEGRRESKTKVREVNGSDVEDVASVDGSNNVGTKRAASEANLEDSNKQAKAAKMTKKERQRLEKEQRERERLERKEQQRLEKERKKKERDAKRERDLAKARQPVDLDRQCGVITEAGAAPCSRSLTCKTHSMAMKRAVVGRSRLFDALLQAHLAKSRSAAAAKNAASRSAAAALGGAAAAVRNATAIALGGENGVLDEDFFGEDSDHGSDSEAECVVAGMGCSRGKPMAVRPTLLPRRRHHYLRVRDLFFDALKPPMGAEPSESLAT
ncbi:SAGA complex subunit Sgf73 [Coemansia sp. RSA 1722]|nr:SAGA complex subunit Sgf73 [Coemansia sp. RSA 485]KAJ2606837.1 SAGA complex subunit Sgf73 [Coemansia sp. RSA 1722]